MKLERGLSQKDGLANRYNYKLLNQSWLTRKLNKRKTKKHQIACSQTELRVYGMTIHGLRENHEFVWI
jgi:hypothetical protein